LLKKLLKKFCLELLINRKEVVNVVDEKDPSHNTDQESLGFFGRIGLFYRQIVSELRKVVWPTRNQLTTYTAVVLVFVAFVIAVVSVFDLVLTKVVFWVFG
jgi:preprotein translocase subunit SecE